MRERAFNAKPHEVRAILAGTMTQVRRIALAPASVTGFRHFLDATWDRLQGLVRGDSVRCPFGQSGDRLWVRETWNSFDGWAGYYYAADYEGWGIGPDDDPDHLPDHAVRWKPGFFMPRAASRILLEVVGVRVERLQEVSEADAAAEGMRYSSDHVGPWSGTGERWWSSARMAFKDFWRSVHGPDSWEANPWVWVISFKRVEQA